MSHHSTTTGRHGAADTTPTRRSWRKRRVLGVPVPVAVGIALAGTTAAVAAVLFGVGFQGKGGRAATTSAKWIQPTGSIGYGTINSQDLGVPTIVAGELVLPSNTPDFLPGDAVSYGGRIQNDSGVGAYISGLVPPSGYTVPAGWRVEFDEAANSGNGITGACGLTIDKTGAQTARPIFIKVTDVDAVSGTEVDLTGWKVQLTPIRNATWGTNLGGVTCPAITG